MALNNQIMLDIVANVSSDNLGKLIDQLREAKTEATSLTGSIEGMEAPAKVLNEQVETFKTTTDYVISRAEKLRKSVDSGEMTGSQKETAVQELMRGFQDAKAFESLISGGGSFSIGLARQMLQDLPAQVQKEFNQITPKVMAAIRRGLNPLNGDKNSRITARDLSGMVDDAMWMKGMDKILGQAKSATEEQKRTLLRSLIPTTGALNRSAEYQTLRFGRLVEPRKMPDKVEDVLPELFKGSYTGRGFHTKIKGNTSAGREVLSSAGMDLLAQFINENAIAARAIEQSGLATRDQGGRLVLGGNITKSKLNNAYGSSLWDEFYKRTSGLKEKLHDYWGDDKITREETERRIASRALSGTGGVTSVAMRQLSDLMGDPTLWQKERNEETARARAIQNEQKRLNEQYAVDKINPFTRTKKRVTAAESQATRMLGLQGSDYEYTDLLKLIDLGSYDQSDEEQRKIVQDILSKGFIADNGKRYDIQSIHGTGSKTMLRAIEHNAKERVRKRYAPLAQALGFGENADVWNAFVDKAFDFENPADLGKHMEQLNKMWSPGYQLGSGLAGHKFAFVDFEKAGVKYSDGIGYALEGILPQAIQARFALSGKGSLAPIRASSMLEWGKNAGLLKNGRLMMPGLGGKEVDVSDMSGLFDVSLIKNLKAFNGMSAEEANSALSGLLELFPISAVADYGYDGNAKGLGSQMMSFMSLSPAIMNHQAKALSQRMRELDTNEGKRKYVFNNPNSSPVSRDVNDPLIGDETLANSILAQREVELYRRSLMSRTAAGEWINYSDDVGTVTNKRLTRNPLMAYLLSSGALSVEGVNEYKDLLELKKQGKITDEQLMSNVNASSLHTITGILERAHNRKFTPEEVMKYMTLENGLVDFENEDQAFIGAIRSPTGYGQFVARANYAKILRPVYEALNLDMHGGVGVSDADAMAMASADFDGDQIKEIYGKKYKVAKNMNINDYIATINAIQEGKFKSDYTGPDLVDEVQRTIAAYKKHNIGASETSVQTEDLPTLPGGNFITNMANWMRTIDLSKEATNEMGYYSAVGTRLSQLDLADSIMRPFAVMADTGNVGYDPATTLPKKPKRIVHDRSLYEALRIGQEYSKIPANLEEMFNVGEVLDEDGNVIRYTKRDFQDTEVDPNDVFRLSSGRIADLSFLRGFDEEGGLKIDKTNLPSRYSDAVVGGLLALKKTAETRNDDSMTQDLVELFTGKDKNGQELGYGNAGEQTRKLMENRRRILAEFIGHTRFGITDEEADILSHQYAASLQEIDQDVRAREKAFQERTGSTAAGTVLLDNGTTAESWKYKNQQIGKYGLNQAALMLGKYRAKINGQEVTLDTGLIYSKLKDQYGQDFADELMGGAQTSLAYMDKPEVGDSYRKYLTSYGNGKEETKSDASLNEEIEKRKELASVNKEIAEEKSRLEQERAQRVKQSGTPSKEELEQKIASGRDLIQKINNGTITNDPGVWSPNESIDTYMNNDLLSLTQNELAQNQALYNSLYGEVSSNKLKELQNRQRKLSLDLFGDQGNSPINSVARQPFDYDAFADAISNGDINTARTIMKGQQLVAAGDELRRRISDRNRSYNKEIFRNDEATQADRWYGTEDYFFKNDNDVYTELEAHLTPEEKESAYWNTLREELGRKNNKYYDARRSHVGNTIKSRTNNMDRAIYGETETDKLLQRREFLDQQVIEAQSEYENFMRSIATNPSTTEEGRQNDVATAQRLSSTIRELESKRDEGYAKIMEESIEMFEQAGDAFDEMLSGKEKRQSKYNNIDKNVKRAKEVADQKLSEIDEQYNKGLIGIDEWANRREEWEARQNAVENGTYRATLERDARSKREKDLQALERTAAKSSGKYDARQQQIEDIYRAAEQIHNDELDSLQYANVSSEERNRLRRESDRAIELAMQAEENINQKSREELQENYMESALAHASPEEMIQEKIRRRRRATARKMDDLLEAKNAGVIQGEEFTTQMQEYAREYDEAETVYGAQLRRDQLVNKQQQYLSADNAQRQFEASIQNRSFTREEQFAQLRNQMIMSRDQTAQKLRQAYGDEFANEFLNNNTIDNINQSINDRLDRQDAQRDFQQQQREFDLDYQNQMASRQRQHQYDQYSHQRFGRRTIFEQRYRQGENRRYELESQYLSNQHNADRTQRQIDRWKEERQSATGDRLQELNNNIKNGEKQLEGYRAAASAAREEMNSFGSVANAASAGIGAIGDKMMQLGRNLGHQLFARARKEIVQFVKQFDKSMTEIQMITLKSDDQIGSLGKHLIDVSLQTGSTVSETTSAAANLYRQGLSDEQVDARLEDVLKFSKVTGIKTEEASKIITTALQNDLVDTSTEAMDALVALGDSAATTASEISKGMQKSAASAKQAGMSYGELVTLLTIGTSKTQLGGSAIGTSLNTLIYRLYKVNKNEDFYDENGQHVMATDATKALDRMGISLFDEEGNFRGPYQILQDIATGWEGADDITQSAILSTLGAGRQRSNIATLLQGLAADEGQIAGRYLDTAENSQGITDKKYESYLDSLEAKLNNVRTSFDQLVASFNSADIGKGFLEGISELIQGLTAANEASNGLLTVIPAIGIAIAAMASFVMAHPVVAGLVVAAMAITGLISDIGNNIKANDPEVQYQKNLEMQQNRYNNYTEGVVKQRSDIQSAIEEQNDLYDKWQKAKAGEGEFTKEDQEKYEDNLSKLSDVLPGFSSAVNQAGTSIEGWSSLLGESQTAISNFSAAATNAASELSASLHRDINKKGREEEKKILEEYGDLKAFATKEDKEILEVAENDVFEALQSGPGVGMFKNAIRVQDKDFDEANNKVLTNLLTYVFDENQSSQAFIKDGWEQRLVDYGFIDSKADFDRKYIQVDQLTGEKTLLNNSLAQDFYRWITTKQQQYYNANGFVDYDTAHTSQVDTASYLPTLQKYAPLLATAFNQQFRGTTLAGTSIANELLSFDKYTSGEDFAKDISDNFLTLRTELYGGSQYLTDFVRQAILESLIDTTDGILRNTDYIEGLKSEKAARLSAHETSILEEHVRTAQQLGFDDITSSIIFDQILRKNGGKIGDWVYNPETLDQLYDEIAKYYEDTVAYEGNSERLPYEYKGQRGRDERTAYAKYAAKQIADTEAINNPQYWQQVYNAAYAQAYENYQPIQEQKSFTESYNDAIELYRTANAKAITADTFLKDVQSNNINNFADLLKSVDNGVVKSWQSLLTEMPELSNTLRDFGIFEFDSDGKLVGLSNAADDTTAAFASLIAAIQGASDRYKDNKNVYTQGQTLDQALAYTQGSYTEENKTAFDNLIGSAPISQAYKNYIDDYKDRKEKYNAARRALGNDYTDDELAEFVSKYGEEPTFEPSAANLKVSEFEAAHVQRLLDNAQNGIYGLKPEDRFAVMGEVVNQLQQGTYKDWTSKMVDPNVLKQYTSGYESFIDAYQRAEGEAQKKDALKGLLDQLNEDKVKDITNLSKVTERYAKALALLASSEENERKKGAMLLKQEIEQMNARQAALKKAKGKSFTELQEEKIKNEKGGKVEDHTLELVLESLQINESEAKQMSADLFQQAIDVALADNTDQFNSMINEYWETHPLTIEGDIPAHVTGSLSWDELTQALGSSLDAANAEAWALLNSMVGDMGSLTFEVSEDGKTVTVTGVLNGNGSTSSPKPSGGGGGGGGGKSPLDKMLERQKHDISDVEHRIKMAQIEEEFADHMNNQGQYLHYLDTEISLQNELSDVLETNIRELQAQIATLESGTDEWYKATQQLWEYEESLSNIKNTIFELGGKHIEIEAKMQDIADKPGTHIGNMLQMRAERYQSLGQFENYESAMNKAMNQTRADIDLNEQQIKNWEAMLSLYKENDENWIEVRDKIWAIKEENAQLENQLLNDTLNLQQARIDQIATDLQNSMAPYEHELNMLSTLGQIYQNNEQWGSYRSTLTSSSDYSRDQIRMYEATIDEMKKEMAALEEGSAAWYSARDAIYQYEEAIAQANATMQENEASMRESYITELASQYQNAEANIQHELNMAKTTAERFDKNNDFVNYQNMLREELSLTDQSLTLYNDKLLAMEDLLNSGKVGEGGEQWRNLKEQILSLREEINNTEASYEELERLIAQSQLDHLIERFNMLDELSQHNIKMIQYEETRYQNQGELTNVNTMLGFENNEQRNRAEAIVAYIEQLKEQRDQLEAGSDSYKKATTEIYKWEEQLKQVNNTIEKNTETIKKNEQAILKTYKTLEDSLNNEIKTREQEERDQLSATVSLQKSILDVIRARYRQEWQLITQDLNKKKQALNEEKQLISERLNARKQAIDTQEKYEELAELRRQLALIQSDPTRTKDAKELRKQIRDLEKDLSWEVAEQEAEAAMKMLDDEQKALDQWQQYQENELNDMLKNANSPQLAEELAQVLGDSDMSREERIAKYMDWLAQNDENYKYGTEAMRLQMAQNSEDAWNKMLGFVETYWDEIKAIIDGGAETIANFITERSAQRGMSETGIEIQRLTANDMYDAYVSAMKDTADWDHSHDVVESIKDLVDYTYKVELVEGSLDPYSDYETYLKYQHERDKTNTDDYVVDDFYYGTGKKEDPYTPRPAPQPTPTPAPAPSGGGGSAPKKNEYSFTLVADGVTYVQGGFSSEAEAEKAGKDFQKSMENELGTMEPHTYDMSTALVDDTKKKTKNKNGGLVDYTGLAWVDGTFSEPEAFLSAKDTKMIRNLLDAFNYVYVSAPHIPSSDMFGSTNNTVGDINITINQAELKSDADIEKLAKQVGKAFNKELTKQGFSTANYSF